MNFGAEKEARVFSWTSVAGEDLIHAVPEGAKLHLGDSVVVEDHQCARFTAGGRHYWFRNPGLYTIGYDGRSESEILQANLMGEDLQDMPMLVNTSLVFCNLKKRLAYELQLKDYVMINRMAGVKPAFRLELSVVDAQKLLAAVVPGENASQQLLGDIGKQIGAYLEDLFYTLFTEYSAKEEIQSQLADRTWKQETAEQMRAVISCDDTYGVCIDGLEIENWNLWVGFCSVCGEPVNARDGVCKNRHRLYRCPVCSDLLYDGICISGGHNVMFCPDCGRYVVPENGHCRTHPSVKQV